MNSALSFWTITFAIAVGAVSPGPSFIMVAKTAMAVGRRQALLTAVGMGLAGALYAALAVFGLAALLLAAGPVFIALRVLGASYLAYIGVTMIMGAKRPLPIADTQASPTSGLFGGFKTQASNPKTVVVYASVFASLLPHSPEPWLFAALPATIGMVEGGWYVLVAILFSTARASATYAKAKPLIDRIAGALMIALAIKLALG